MKNFNLDLQALKACSVAMSKEESRYYLRGVHIFERKGVIVYEATNGQMAIRVESDLQNEEFDFSGINLILPDFIVKNLCKVSFLKPFGIEGPFIPCAVDGTRINIEMLEGLINVKLVDGTFPDVDRVFPSASGLTLNKVNLNGKYMDALSKSISVYSKTPCIELQFTGDAYGSPILVQSNIAKNWSAVIMQVSI